MDKVINYKWYTIEIDYAERWSSNKFRINEYMWWCPLTFPKLEKWKDIVLSIDTNTYTEKDYDMMIQEYKNYLSL